jgi:hypothetical protein
MKCEGKIYAGQIGVKFEIATWMKGCPAVDWSGATTIELIFSMPDRSIKKVDAVLASDNHTLTFITTTKNDIPISGLYQVQAHVAGPGYDALGETAQFTVYGAFR